MSMLQDLIRSRLRGGAGSQGQTRMTDCAVPCREAGMT